MKRDESFMVRTSKIERDRLLAVAKHHELTLADAIRLSVRKEYERITAERPRKKP